MAVNVGLPNQNLSVTTDMTFTIEENYFVNKIHSQIQHHLTTLMDDMLFESLFGLGLGAIDSQKFTKVSIQALAFVSKLSCI